MATTSSGHTGEADSAAKSSLTENGKKLRLFGFPGFQNVKLNPGPGTVVYSLTSTLRRPAGRAVLADDNELDLPHLPRPVGEPRRAAWICANANFVLTQKCSIPSMISLNYTVANLGLNGVAPAGAQTVDAGRGPLPALDGPGRHYQGDRPGVL